MKNAFFLFTAISTTFLFSCSKDDDNKYEQPTPPAAPQATVVKASGDLTAATYRIS